VHICEILSETYVLAVTKTVVDVDKVGARFWELGFPTVQQFQDALLEGNLARSTCTKLDPPSFRGTTGWAVPIRSLRRQMLPAGWTKNDKGNFSRTVAPDGNRQIVVSTGTSGTGKEKGKPKTRSFKGPKALTLLALNTAQYELDALLAQLPIEVPEPEAEREPETWWLLIQYRRAKSGTWRIYSELSLPDGRIEPNPKKEKARIVGWSERLILPRIDIAGEGTRQRIPEPGPEFDVSVSRRAV
jgi:hypothetical protein